jgi:hypothetical protein
MQGRSGLRPSAVQFLVDVLNGDAAISGPAKTAKAVLSSLPSDFDGLGAALRTLVAQELSAKGDEVPLSGAEAAALALGSGSLAVIGCGALCLSQSVQASGSVDAVASLTAAAVCGSGSGLPCELKEPEATYELRPHRSVTSSAATLKILLRDPQQQQQQQQQQVGASATASSSSTTSGAAAAAAAVKKELVSLPQLHGPAIEALLLAAKAVAVELNSAEKGPLLASTIAFVPGPALAALRSCKASLTVLVHASRRRLGLVRKGIRPWMAPNPSEEPSPDLLDEFALVAAVAEEVETLQACLVGETEASLSALQVKKSTAEKATALAREEAASAAAAAGKGGAAESAAVAAAAAAVSPEVAKKLAAAKAADEARLAAMKPSDRDKYLKKKADKEAKEKAKADAKKAKQKEQQAAAGGGGGSGSGGSGGSGGGEEEEEDSKAVVAAKAAAVAVEAARVSPGVAALQDILPQRTSGGGGGGDDGSSVGEWSAALVEALSFSLPSGLDADQSSSTSCLATNGCFAASVEDLVEKLGSGGARRTPKIAKGTRDFGPEQMKVRVLREERVESLRKKIAEHTKHALTVFS